MIRFAIIAVAVLGACSTVETRDDQRDTDRLQSSVESQLDDLIPIDPPPDDPGPGAACNGTPGQWNGCRGNGCAVCSEQLTNAPCYFQNHPGCARNDTCGGLFFTCNAACPAPTAADINCGTCDGTPGQWNGCRGNGCAVCSEQLTNAPCYFLNHPSCVRNDTCGGLSFTCNAACPAPTVADITCGAPPRCGDGVCDANEFRTCPTDCAVRRD